MENAPLKISISGIRGIVGKTLTEAVVRDFAEAFATVSKKGKILVAQDTRPSGKRFRRLAAEALRGKGRTVVDLGITPTPTVLLNVRLLRAAGGMVLTASHNPSEWNGLKFVGADGQFLDTGAMKRLVRTWSERSFLGRAKRGTISQNRSGLSRHVRAILRGVNVRKIRAARFHVAIDPCNGTGAVVTEPFLKALGCRVTAINNRPDGRCAHPPEPTPAHLSQLASLVKKKGAQIGFAQDPDGDRLAVVSDQGIPLSGEYTLALAVDHILSKKRSPIVINLSTSRMIEDLARQRKVKVYRSKIGERYVIEKMRKVKAGIGGEGNGGVIYPAINPARDSLVGIALILESLAESGKTVSELISRFSHYEMMQEKLTLSKEKMDALLAKLPTLFKGGKVTRLDGVRIDLPRGWIHARPSNTEPIVRLIAEAPSQKEAKSLLDTVLKS